MQSRYIADQNTSSSHKLKGWLVLLAFLALAGHAIGAKHVSAEHLAAEKATASAAKIAKQKETTFDTQVASLMATDPDDTISVVTTSNVSGVHTLGNTDVFDGASTGKLLTAADYLTHVQNGTASLDHLIDGETAQNWMQKMIVDSDNDAWAELNDYLTHPDLSKYAASVGFVDYDPTVNTFTSTDIASLMQKLYVGSLLKPAERTLLLGYMKQANYRQYIVSAVPSAYTVYHKIGFDDDELNDVAIITKGDKYLVLAIYTNGNGRYDQDFRTTMMHQITQDALTAFM